MSKYAEHVQTKSTPQTEAVPGKNQVQNNAGGFVFAVDDWARLDRFLILGAEGGTYYAEEKELTRENAQVVTRCLNADPTRTVARIVEVSDAGRAPKNDPAVFALAMAASHNGPNMALARQLALTAIPKVCRIGTHLFQFVAACDAMRGWGAGLRAAVSAWYTDRNTSALGRQVTKYQQRNGWSHKDVLRLCHAHPGTDGQHALFRWIHSGVEGLGDRTVVRGKETPKTKTYKAVDRSLLPLAVNALEELKVATSAHQVIELIGKYKDDAPRELVPTQFLKEPSVWEALLETMPMTAMIRNLGNMSKSGLVKPLSNASRTIATRLHDPELLKKARVHPLGLLLALKTYQSGAGMKGSGEWTPDQAVVDALNDAFYLAFDAIEPTGKRWLFGVDVSGSMGSPITGMPISCAEAATALAMVGLRTEPWAAAFGFADTFKDLGFGKATRLDDALRKTRGMNFGTTDCAVPMVHAMRNKLSVDTFCILTDSETYAGNPHPFQALKQYRDTMGINAKLIVVGMTASGFTIADPSDAGMLDVVGFGTDVPAVMAEFARS